MTHRYGSLLRFEMLGKLNLIEHAVEETQKIPKETKERKATVKERHKSTSQAKLVLVEKSVYPDSTSGCTGKCTNANETHTFVSPSVKSTKAEVYTR